MPAYQVEAFVENEAGYLNWIKSHPHGFVLNTSREMSPSYMVLHRANCPLMGQYSKEIRPGGFTKLAYVKICGLDIESLRAWVKWHGRPDGTFTSECAVCRPGL